MCTRACIKIQDGTYIEDSLGRKTNCVGSDDAKVDHYLTTDGYPLLPDEVEDKH